MNQAGSNEIFLEMYLPFTVLSRGDLILVLIFGPAEGVEQSVSSAQIYAADPMQPVMEDQSLETQLRENAYARPRFNLLLFSVFAALGLLLALFGIYGVISHTVAQQTREIGIRIALGAGFSQVIVMVLSSGLRLLALGIAIGLAASLASVKLLSGLVRNVSAFSTHTHSPP